MRCGMVRWIMLDTVKGIVVVVQCLQGYDVQLNNEEHVRVGSRTCSEMVPSYSSHEGASSLLLRALLLIRPLRNDRFRSL